MQSSFFVYVACIDKWHFWSGQSMFVYYYFDSKFFQWIHFVMICRKQCVSLLLSLNFWRVDKSGWKWERKRVIGYHEMLYNCCTYDSWQMALWHTFSHLTIKVSHKTFTIRRVLLDEIKVCCWKVRFDYRNIIFVY